MRTEAQRVVPGATAAEARRHLDARSEVIKGTEQIRQRLQLIMDEAIADLDGTHFDLAEPIRRVEAHIAPAGSAAAPYYTSRRRISPGPAGPGCPPSARPASRSGT